MELEDNITGDPVIDFNTLDEKIEKNINSDDFATLGPIFSQLVQNPDLKFENVYKKVISDFNKQPLTKILSSPTPSIEIFMLFLRSQTPIKICHSIAVSWPPAVPKLSDTVLSFFKTIVKIANAVKNKENFVTWIYSSLFPRLWTRRSSALNPLLHGIGIVTSRKFSGKKLWLVVDSQSFVRLYESDGNFVDPVYECRTRHIRAVENDENSITFTKKTGQEFITVQPSDPELVPYWLKIFDKNDRTAFPLFICEPTGPFPEIYITAVYHAITSNDLFVAKALCSPNVMSARDGAKIVEYLFDIFCYDGKAHQFMETLILQEIEDPNMTSELLLRGNSQLTNLFKVFTTRFGKSYVKKFLIKVIDYIDDKGDLKITTPEECNKEEVEKAFMTVIKYITNSINYIPQEIRHLCSILRSYCAIRFNDRQTVCNGLSGFFFLRFVSAAIAAPQVYISDYKPKNQGVLVPFAKLLQVAFNFSLFEPKNPDFAYMDERMQFHVFPMLEEFLFALGDVSVVPPYEAPTMEEVRGEVENVAIAIAKHHKAFTQEYLQLLNPSSLSGCNLGWNFACAVSNCFKHSYDPDRLEEYRNTLRQSHAAIVSQQMAKTSHLVELAPLPDAPVGAEFADHYNYDPMQQQYSYGNPQVMESPLAPESGNNGGYVPEIAPADQYGNPQGYADQYYQQQYPQYDDAGRQIQYDQYGQPFVYDENGQPIPYQPQSDVNQAQYQSPEIDLPDFSAAPATLDPSMGNLDALPTPKKSTPRRGKKGAKKSAATIDGAPTPKKSTPRRGKKGAKKSAATIDGKSDEPPTLAAAPKKKARGKKKAAPMTLDPVAPSSTLAPTPKKTGRRGAKKKRPAATVEGVAMPTLDGAPSLPKKKKKAAKKKGSAAPATADADVSLPPASPKKKAPAKRRGKAKPSSGGVSAKATPATPSTPSTPKKRGAKKKGGATIAGEAPTLAPASAPTKKRPAKKKGTK